MATRSRSRTKAAGDEREVEQKELPERELSRRMYETMVLMRATDDRLVAMYRQGQLPGSYYSGNWHEAIAVGTAAALRDDDAMAPLHRDMGAHLWRGLQPREVIASFIGKVGSPTKGRDATLHYGRLDLKIFNPVSQIPDNYPVATGAAFAAKYRGEDSVAIAYCGDGSTSMGWFHEALNIAAVMRLPCIFIVENNQYAYSTPLRLQMATADIACKAVAYGMPGERVDGQDVVAVYEATRRAADRARAGEGPSLIECLTMRMHGHAEHDPGDYVPKELYEEWAKRDPVELFEQRLVEAGYLDEEEAKRIKDETRKFVLAEVAAVRDMPYPDPATVEEGVYAD
jgi:TPP-dependent pyruvate/acetoin dehydrogenase alpha subunit